MLRYDLDQKLFFNEKKKEINIFLTQKNPNCEFKI